jgi:dolichol-phosphate mannosyltransferase
VRSIIVLPTYNERDNLGPLLRAVRTASEAIDVLVVDDASPDGTAAAARELGVELGGIRVVLRASKEGLGSAYRAGFARALADGYDVVISMDADLSHDPAVIPTMLAEVDAGADVVVGSRYVDGGRTADWPLHRRLLSRWGNAYTRRVLALPTRDCTSGYRAYRAETLAAIDPATTSAEGYAFLTELLRRSVALGVHIVEVPIVFRDRTRGTSKMSARIIVESMVLVTRWGLSDLLRRHRSPRRTR